MGSETAAIAKLGALVTLLGLLVLLGLVRLGGDPTEAIKALPYLLGGGLVGGAGLAATYGWRHWGAREPSSSIQHPSQPPAGEP